MTTRRLPLLAAGAAAAVVLVATNQPGQLSPEAEAAASPLAAAVDACNLTASPHVDVLDNDHTLAIQGDGDETGGLQIGSVACLLTEVGVTDAVVARMDRTRALDGTQDATWGDYEASWTFHPDAGLNVLITWGGS